MKKILALLIVVTVLLATVTGLSGCKKETQTEETYDPYTYDSDAPIVYQSGVARVWQINNDKYLYGFIDESGKVIIPCIYEGTSNDIYEEEYIIVKKDDKYGILTTDGKTFLDCEYDLIYIENGVANLEKDGDRTTVELVGTEQINKDLDEIIKEIEDIEFE